MLLCVSAQAHFGNTKGEFDSKKTKHTHQLMKPKLWSISSQNEIFWGVSFVFFLYGKLGKKTQTYLLKDSVT